MNNIIHKIGFWSAISTLFFTIAYGIPQLIIGIDMPSSPKDIVYILLPSILLAPSFLITMISVHYYAPQNLKIWSHIGIMFAGAYFVFVSIVYFVGLTIQLPHTIAGDLQKYELLKYEPKSFMTAIDALGYATMSLSTLFSAQVFINGKLEKWIRIFFIANGVIFPIILLTQVYPMIAYAGASWLITFPGSIILLIALFRKQIKDKSLNM